MAVQRETIKVVKPFVEFLKTRNWHYENIHGNQFQRGLPDGYFSHPQYSPRWIEFKVLMFDSKHHPYICLTDAQKKKFPVLLSNNVPIYVVAAEDLRGSRGRIFDEKKCMNYYKIILGKPNGLFALSKRTVSELLSV